MINYLTFTATQQFTNQNNNFIPHSFQQINQNIVRETNDFPSQVQESTTTFTPVKLEEVPLKPMNTRPEQILSSAEQINKMAIATEDNIEIPKYNFEELLERALQDQGENIQEETTESSKLKSKINKSKFLTRKKKYDPKEAIKKDKIRKKGKSKRHKSAFPSGLLKENKEESESKVSPRSIKKSNKSSTRKQTQPKLSSDSEQTSKNEEGEFGEEEGQHLNEENKKNIKSKPFLKRRENKIKFHKLNWNKIKSKTDCWTKKSSRSEHREKSTKRLAKNKQQNKTKTRNEKEFEKQKLRNKTFNNVKSRIDTGIRKDQQKFGSNDSINFELYNIGGLGDESSNSFINQRGKFNYLLL